MCSNVNIFEDRNEMIPDAFIELVKLCITTTCQQFREEHYELADGLAMVSPASPSMAKIYMDKIDPTRLTAHRPKDGGGMLLMFSQS